MTAATAAAVRSPQAIAAFARARAMGDEAALWMRPADGSAVLGVGAAERVAVRGPDRVAALRRAWSDLRRRAPDAHDLRAFVGISFDDPGGRGAGPDWTGFPAAELVVPRIRIDWRPGGAVRVTARNEDRDEADALLGGLTAVPRRAADAPLEVADELPSRESWRAGVVAAREAIRSGTLEKVVLARAACVRVGPGAVPAALAALVARARGGTVYAVARGEAAFLGATPESLVALERGVARVSCVAGTAARDDDAEADAAAGVALLGSDKDRREHEVVVRAAREALERRCDEVTVRGPDLLGLATLWHLSSDVRGRVRRGAELLDLAAELHPTPAVCGSPRDAAARFIEGHEPFARGWYAGALGWVDAAGEGELVVALRSALVRPDGAWVFAGCGIVDGSDPDAELAEADAKMAPTIDALGGSPA